MNLAAPLVVPILATPFGVVALPGTETLNPALCDLFTARMQADATARPRSSLCYRGGDDLFNCTDEPVKRVTAAILKGMYAVVQSVNDFGAGQLESFKMQARGWFTVVLPNGRISATNHPLTAWCGVYCVAAPEVSTTRADSGLLRFYETRLGNMFADATTDAMRLPFRPGHYGWRPVPGQLAVFPASLTHEVALIQASGQLVLVTVLIRFVAPGQQGLTRW